MKMLRLIGSLSCCSMFFALTTFSPSIASACSGGNCSDGHRMETSISCKDEQGNTTVIGDAYGSLKDKGRAEARASLTDFPNNAHYEVSKKPGSWSAKHSKEGGKAKVEMELKGGNIFVSLSTTVTFDENTDHCIYSAELDSALPNTLDFEADGMLDLFDSDNPTDIYCCKGPGQEAEVEGETVSNCTVQICIGHH